MSYINWSDLNEDWSATSEYWWSEAAPVIEVIRRVGGDTRAQLAAYEKLKKEDKKKIFRLVMYYNKLKFQESREVKEDSYVVTASDIQMIVEEFEKRKELIESKVNVQDIKIYTDLTKVD